MTEFAIEVGGLGTTVKVPDPHLADMLLKRYAAFLTDPNSHHSVLDLTILDKPIEEGIRLPTVTSKDSVLRISRWDTLAESIDNGRNWAVSLVSNEYTFDSFLRVFLTLRLLDEDGFLIHSSAQIRRDTAYIFTGKSEAGKTTISDLGTENLVLCDELPMVRRVDGSYRVYGTPFWGKFTKGTITDSGEVGALFFLNKAPYNRAAPLSLRSALPRLLQTTLFFSNHPAHIERLMRICVAFLEEIPSHDLYFRPEPEVWTAVDHAIGT